MYTSSPTTPTTSSSAEATTVANGTYRIDTSSVADGTPLRIEFDDAQRPGDAHAVSGDYQSSFHGADNGTSVQFAAAGDANVDFGVLEPEDFAAHNAPILTAIQYAGLRTDAAGTLPTVVANPWVVPPNDPANGNFPGRVNLATYGQIGSVWGTAFDRAQNAAYVSATYKRISDLGPLGLGGIYRITQGPRRERAAQQSGDWHRRELSGRPHSHRPRVAIRSMSARSRQVRNVASARRLSRLGIPTPTSRPARWGSVGSRSPKTVPTCSS